MSLTLPRPIVCRVGSRMEVVVEAVVELIVEVAVVVLIVCLSPYAVVSLPDRNQRPGSNSDRAQFTLNSAAIPTSPAAHPKTSTFPPPSETASSRASIRILVSVGPWGWPQTRELPVLFISSQS